MKQLAGTMTMAMHWTLTIPRAETSPAPRRLMATLRLWVRRMSERRALGDLDDRLLRDCGIRPDQARREIEKPFWIR